MQLPYDINKLDPQFALRLAANQAVYWWLQDPAIRKMVRRELLPRYAQALWTGLLALYPLYERTVINSSTPDSPEYDEEGEFLIFSPVFLLR